jgi:O-antigen/teichoic acid export membrane protein
VNVRGAIAWSFAGRYAAFAVRAVGLVVTARLLAPEDFGLFATAAALVSLLFVFVEFGLYSHLVRLPRLSRSAVRSAVGLCLALVAAGLAAFWTAAWLAPPSLLSDELRTAALMLCFGSAVQPLVLPVYAKLQRDLRFDAIAASEAARAAAGVGTTVVLALAGHGFMSLAWGAVADAAASVLFAAAAGRWRRPAWPSVRGWGGLLRFGLPFAAVGGVGRAGDAGTALILAHMLGVGAVGLYSRAKTVTDTMDKAFMQALAPVVLPALARRLRAGGDLKPLYLRKIAVLTAVQWPFFAVAAALAEPIVAVVLGDRWLAAVPVVQAIALAGLFLPFTDLSLKFFVALDRHGTYAAVQAAVAALRLALVAALATVSLTAAVLGIAAAWAVRAAAVTVLLERRLGCTHAEIAARLWPSAAATAAAAVAPAAVWAGALGPPGPAEAVLAGALAVAGWAVGLVLCGHELADEGARVLRASAGRARHAYPALRSRLHGWMQ